MMFRQQGLGNTCWDTAPLDNPNATKLARIVQEGHTTFPNHKEMPIECGNCQWFDDSPNHTLDAHPMAGIDKGCIMTSLGRRYPKTHAHIRRLPTRDAPQEEDGYACHIAAMSIHVATGGEGRNALGAHNRHTTASRDNRESPSHGVNAAAVRHTAAGSWPRDPRDGGAHENNC